MSAADSDCGGPDGLKSGAGAPSLSIVVNELVQVGIKTIIRIGTTGDDEMMTGANIVRS